MLGNHGIAGGGGHVVMVLTANFLLSSQHPAVSIQLTPKKVVFIEKLPRFASMAKGSSPDSRGLCSDIYISSGGNVWIDQSNS